MPWSYNENVFSLVFKWFFNLLNSTFDFVTNFAFSNPLFFSIVFVFVLSLIYFVIRWLYYAIIIK